MRIAVTYNNDQVFQHFGHTSFFKIYDIENGRISNQQIIDTMGREHGSLTGFLKEVSADTLICGGIGGGAQRAIEAAGVELYTGIEGNADEAVKAYLAGSLQKNGGPSCNHHHEEGHHHHEHCHDGKEPHDHECGTHGCGHH